jgi:hypothetical protein
MSCGGDGSGVHEMAEKSLLGNPASALMAARKLVMRERESTPTVGQLDPCSFPHWSKPEVEFTIVQALCSSSIALSM